MDKNDIHTENKTEIIKSIAICIDDDIERLLENKSLKMGIRQIPKFDEYNIYQSILESIDNKEESKKKGINIFRYTKWISACIISIIVFSIGHYLYQNGQAENLVLQEINTKKGEKMLVLLPDGSRVWLNADSKLVYPEQFAKSKRDVTLVGEAYFEVKKNNRSSFHVLAENIKVEVKGTSFNVSAYPSDREIITTLDEGKISISHSASRSSSQDMIPGQTAIFKKQDNTINISDNEYYKEASSWKQNQLAFRNSSLEEVLVVLSRQFDIKFEIKNPRITSFTYNFIRKGSDLSNILKTMESITPIKFKKITEDNYIVE